MPLQIAFRAMGDAKWVAGIHLIRELILAVQQTRPEQARWVLVKFHEAEYVPEDLEALAHEAVTLPAMRRWSVAWALDRATVRLLGRDRTVERILRGRGVDAIAFGSLRGRTAIPVLGWLPDFQHVHRPELHTAEERSARDRAFQHVARESARVLLLSETVRQDFAAFAPAHAHKARVLRPVAFVPERVYDADLRALVEKYHLPERFIYLPNQFWRHKGHDTAFHAIEILAGRGLRVPLVCSGYPRDPRATDHFAGLLRQVSEWGIQNQVIVLGLVPRDDVFGLIRQSVCVLNPSTFEGFGLSAEEARSVGKRMVLSDLPAHREHAAPAATFFEPDDAESLAEAIAAVWADAAPGPDLELEADARARQPERIRQYADTFLGVVREVAEA